MPKADGNCRIVDVELERFKVSEMAYTVSSWTLNSTIPYRTVHL